ncbi:LysR family transcriptional regulator [Szabonella alba]|uniref:LysR family transcriptional regulator n=1 Tax=Szabonella alba TaxID=2804194 RepID=A0A8K0VC49_9RHOB|nr:LysR family transcriptional regulator [Szabonella alba]MBL4918986.1 LysR family transcriptional regulator [Szabonella alba]
MNFIRSFESAARHLSFTRAAQELGYTQAAISTHIRGLEKYLGRDLFVRGTRSIALTEIGEAFLPTLRQALHQIDSATEGIATTSRDRSVIVACPLSLAENWLPGCLARFRAASPGIEVVVNATIWDNPDDEIADISISVNRNDEVPMGATPLWGETLSFVCSPALARDLDEGKGLSSRTRILIAGRQEYWKIFQDAPGLAVTDAGAALKTNSTNVALEMAVHGMGVTIALTSLCDRFIDRGLLVEPFAIRPPSPWAYYGQEPPARRSTGAHLLWKHILAEVDEVAQRRNGPSV